MCISVVHSAADPGRGRPGRDVCGLRPGALRRPLHPHPSAGHALSVAALQPQLCAGLPGQLHSLRPLQPGQPTGGRSSNSRRGEAGGRSVQPISTRPGGRSVPRPVTCSVADLRGQRGAQRGGDGGGGVIMSQQQQRRGDEGAAEISPEEGRR